MHSPYSCSPSRTICQSLAIICVLLGAAAAFSAEPAPAFTPDDLLKAEKIFREIYGAEEKKVEASKLKTDKVRFAKKLVDARGDAKDSPAIVHLMTEKAIRLAMADSTGYQVALGLLRERVPKEGKDRAAALAKVADVQAKIYTHEPIATRPAAAKELVAAYRLCAEEYSKKGEDATAATYVDKAKLIARNGMKPAEGQLILREIEAAEKEAGLARKAAEREAEAKRKAAEERTRLAAALETNPKDPKANLGMALIHFRDGKTALAARCLENCEAKSLRDLGNLLSNSKTEPAIVAGAARTAVADFSAGKVYLLILAKERYEEVIRIDPKYPEAVRLKLLISELGKQIDELGGSGADASVFELFDDNKNLVQLLIDKGEGPGKVEFCTNERHSGTSSLKVHGGGHRYMAPLPGWKFSIVETPKAPNEARYITLAWKKVLGKQIALGLHSNKGWVAYSAGPENPNGWVQVTQTLPKDWSVVTRDLFKDFGPCVIDGISFISGDGEDGYFDRIYLGRNLEALQRIRK